MMIMILTFITITVMALLTKQWKALIGLMVAFGVLMMIDITPTLEVMWFGGLAATWHSLINNGERHGEVNTHH